MAFDYKKEYKEFYLPPKTPGIITVPAMEEYAKAQGYEADFGENRFHHESYLSDVRHCKPVRLKTVIQHPVRRIR